MAWYRIGWIMYAIMYFDGVKSGLWVLSEEAVAVAVEEDVSPVTARPAIAGRRSDRGFGEPWGHEDWASRPTPRARSTSARS